MEGTEGAQEEHTMVHTTPQEQPQTPENEVKNVSLEKKQLGESVKPHINGSSEVLINGHTHDAAGNNNIKEQNGENGLENHTNESAEKSETEEKMEVEKKEEGATDQDVVLIQDTGFTIQIVAPGLDPFDLPVSSMELVQEIFQVLVDREDTCHRTCFSLQLDGVTLDNFAELKSIEGLQEGSVIKVVEEPYTVREARIHVRHVRDLLKSVDLSDSYNGVDCYSLSFLNTVTNGDILDKKKSKPESVDCTPPDFIMPGSRDRPILPLHPTSKDQKAPQCVKVLTYSGWNPPPGNRKMHGDILYLYIVTLEDKRYHITASTRGFYVNQSTQDEFNPKPAPQKHLSHSLIDLLNQISPAFKRNLAILLKKRAHKHPFERVATPYQVYSWLSPSMDHQVDSIRAEDAFSSRLGYEEHIPGQTRDWNEELQTTRELSRKNLPERLIRERAIFKVHSDFVVAATRGAMAVIDGNIMAINPGEESKMQMFLWNNIFFSLGFDVKDHYKDFGGDYAAFAAPNSDLAGVRAYSSLDTEGLYTLGTVVVDYRGYRVTAQSIIPGILEREQEQSVVYGSIDFGKTVVSHEKYRELLQKTATQLKIRPHKVLSEKGDEVELFSSVECKGIIGNDNRHYILDLLRTFPPDVNFLKAEGEELSEEVQALSFPRQHRHKLICLRQELIDAFVENRYIVFVKHAAYQFQQLRLKRQLSANAEKEAKNKEADKSEENKEKDEKDSETEKSEDSKEKEVKDNDAEKCEENKEKEEKKSEEGKIESKDIKEDEIATDDAKKIVESLTGTDSNTFETDSKEIVKNAAKIVGSVSDKEFNITFNPDVYQPHVSHANPDSDSLTRDKKLVKDAAEFLLLHQIPAFIKDCLEHTSSPIDGFTLTEALHHNGINMRYLGTVTEMVAKHAQLSYLHSICISELICRSVRHLFRMYIQGVEMMNLSAAICHFLNCYLGSCSAPHVHVQDEFLTKQSKKKNKKKNKSLTLSSDSTEWVNETPKTLWKKIVAEIQDYFHYSLKCDSCDSLVENHGIQKVSMLRAFCQGMGIQMLLREYTMDNKSKQAFYEEDIINMFPNVKHVHPRATDAYHFFNSGQQKIQQGLLREGYDLISEALNLLNNVYGAMHPEIAACARLLARLNYIMGDYVEALSFQQRAVLMSERVLGIDHPNTITEYFHLALYCFANNQVSNALRLMYRARYLALLCHGEHHPEIALFDSNIGLVLHAVGEFDLSLRFLQHSLDLNSKFFGEKSLKVAMSYHLVARTFSCKGDFRTALQHEKEAFAIYKQQLGEEHERTRESSECLKHLTTQAVKFQKTMNELYRGEKGITIPPIQIQYPSMASVLDTLNLINGIVFLHISPEDIEKFRTEMIRRHNQQSPEASSAQALEQPAKSEDSTQQENTPNDVTKEADDAGR